MKPEGVHPLGEYVGPRAMKSEGVHLSGEYIDGLDWFALNWMHGYD